MRYLITTKDFPPYLTDWFESANNFNAKAGMVVYDLYRNLYTTNGNVWVEIKIDRL